MYAIRKLGLLAAVRTLQTTERVLDGLLLTRPYLPFALMSLIAGFAVGFFLAR